MNLTISPPFYGGYNYHIGTNSSYFINANGASGTVYYKCHLYCWSGARTITTPLEPIVTIEKEVLNQHSYYFDISDYLKILIEPEIHDFLNSEDYDCGYRWVCWKIEYFDGLSNLIHTYSSPQYFASAGFRWNEYVSNAPRC
ncbi:hypothetical protein [Paenimyroides baculatum]|uniref:Uncharacterized protein n=1 Tax=Paenimyroides baculatum TaxID=2608000 RepID=A0A5M6CH45_9FLAO|nr:hypothetical protein [Paenimyroides baculatum]KAA5534306.1 hypothetical protein F0460_09365 [Paenimyroides baculatum]